MPDRSPIELAKTLLRQHEDQRGYLTAEQGAWFDGVDSPYVVARALLDAKTALTFYADRDTYDARPRRVRPISRDSGERARLALAALRGNGA